jgi:DNA repair protein RadD
LRKAASTHELIKSDLPVVEVFNVDTVTYAIHNKIGKPPSLKVSYYCGLRRFNEFIHFEIPGWGERKAREWWGKRLPPEVNNQGVPVTTATALEWAPKALRVPVRIRVWTNKPYPEVMAVSFGEEF